MHRNEHRANPRGLADLLLPHALIADGILLQQDGSLLTGWSYRGPDMMSAAPAEMDALRRRPKTTSHCTASSCNSSLARHVSAGWRVARSLVLRP